MFGLGHKHDNPGGLKVFEKHGKFGVATEEQFVPQYTFDSKEEAEAYIAEAAAAGDHDNE